MEVELLPGFETATGTDELLVEIVTDVNVLTNDYPGGEGSYESYGYYRYGFNGKENDNEVKGSGNQQDYGMRIYDPWVGRFLSVDPLMNKFAFLSPFSFSNNMPIRCFDLDGGEPKDYSSNWKVLGETFIGKWGQDVKTIYDEWTGKTWSVMNYLNQRNIYYWQPLDGTNGTFDFENNGKAIKDINGNWTGFWQRFEKQETIQARLGRELADGMSTFFVGILALPAIIAASPEIASGTLAARGSSIGIDYSLQVAGNILTGDGIESFTNVNASSLIMSGVNPGNSVKSLFFNNSLSNTFSYDINKGYDGIGGGKSINTVFFETFIGTFTGWAGNKFAGKYLPELNKVSKFKEYLDELGTPLHFRFQKAAIQRINQLEKKMDNANNVGTVVGNVIGNMFDENE